MYKYISCLHLLYRWTGERETYSSRCAESKPLPANSKKTACKCMKYVYAWHVGFNTYHYITIQHITYVQTHTSIDPPTVSPSHPPIGLSVRLSVHPYVHTCIHTYIQTNKHTNKHTYMDTWIHASFHAYMRTYEQMYAENMRRCVCVSTL